MEVLVLIFLKRIKYEIINKQISLADNKYWILSGELNNYSVEQLNETLTEMENVFNGKYVSSSFYGNVVFCVEYNKDFAKIEYYDEYIGEESTIEIYKMLKNFRDRLKEQNS